MYFHRYLGKWLNLTNIFQKGRNHHPETISWGILFLENHIREYVAGSCRSKLQAAGTRFFPDQNPSSLKIDFGFVGKNVDSHQLISPKTSIHQHPIATMYGTFTYIYLKHQQNVGQYTVHGWYGSAWDIFAEILRPLFVGSQPRKVSELVGLLAGVFQQKNGDS